MGRFILLVIVAILAVGCSSAAPTSVPVSTAVVAPTIPAPTLDVSATVEVAVEATREVDRMLRTASGDSRGPTATPVSEALLVPTPDPFVVAPGEIEGAVDQFIDCFHGDAGFRAALLAGMEADLAGSGLTSEEVESFVEELFSDRESFLFFVEEDPNFAVALVAMGEGLHEFCAQDPSGSVSATDSLVVAPGEFLESMAGLYDCMQENETLLAIFLLQFKSWLTAEGVSPAVADALAEAFTDDREVFLELVRLGSQQSPGQVSDVTSLNDFVDALCSGSSGSGRDLGMTDSEATVLLGDLYDCAVSRGDEARSRFMDGFGGPNASEFFETLMSDRDSFVEFMLAVGRLDPELAVWFAELEGLLDAGCP